MSLPQKKYRELLFQFLYSFSQSGLVEEQLIPLMMKSLKISKKNVEITFQQAKQIFLRLDTIDSYLRNTSSEYNFARITAVEKTILRLAVYELLIEQRVPLQVCIAESIRLCKKFGSIDSFLFINAILDKVYNEYTRRSEDH
jgi:N utilization substance protein B